MRYMRGIFAGIGILLLAGCKPAAPAMSLADRSPHLISLAPSITEIVCALGASDQLVGRSSACDYPPDIVKRVPVVGSFGVPSLEQVLVAKPDSVLYSDLADMALDGKLRRVGLKPVRITCNRLDEIPDAMIEVGRQLRREPAARVMADDLRRQIEKFRNSRPPASRPRALVLIWNNPLTAAGKNSFISDLVTLAGGQNVGDEIDRDYFQVSGEWVLSRDPDLIFCFFMAGTTPVRQTVMQRAGWDQLKAVRTGRVYDGFDNSLVLRPGPRVMKGVALITPYIEGCHE